MDKTVGADGGWVMPKPMTKKQFDALVKQGTKQKGKSSGTTQKGKSKNGGRS